MPKKRHLQVSWTPEHEALLGELPDCEVAKITERSPNAVTTKRIRMGIEPCPVQLGYEWEAWEIALLGAGTDVAIAEELGVSRRTVIRERQKRGIPAYCAA